MRMERWALVVLLIVGGGAVGGSLEDVVVRPIAMLASFPFLIAACLVMEAELDRRRDRRRRA